MVIYRLYYEQKRINEQITVPKHTWKVKANPTPMVQMMEKNKQKLSDYIEYVHKHMKCSIGLTYKRRLIIGIYKKTSIIWKYYCLHNVLIIVVSSCRLKSCVSPISRA